MSKVLTFFCACLFAALSCPRAAQAAAGGCSVSASVVAFGTYSPLSSAALSSTGQITFQCNSGGGTVTIMLDAGVNSGGSFANRSLSNGLGALLKYQLYTDAAHTSIWGDGKTPPTTDVTVTYVKQQPVVTTVYGSLPALQNVPAGAYTDTITVTFSY